LMVKPYLKIAVLVLGGGLGLVGVRAQTAASKAAQQKKPHGKLAKPASTPEPTPTPVPLPPTPEQMPARPPQVAFKNGQLTIVAQNSTLADILRAVRLQTGAAIEVPPNATERVFTKLGPGPARDVLASLLNGSHFNYVMLGAPDDPSVVQHVILTSKAGEGAPAATAPNVNAATPGAQPNEEPDAMAQPEDPATDEGQTAVDQGEQPADQAPEDQDQNGQPVAKTPEQLLRELQQQQQQQPQPQQPGAPQGFPQQPPPTPEQEPQ
jgi:hypothetical protein